MKRPSDLPVEAGTKGGYEHFFKPVKKGMSEFEEEKNSIGHVM